MVEIGLTGYKVVLARWDIAELCLTFKSYGNENQGERDKGNSSALTTCSLSRREVLTNHPEVYW
jgi:hypothetical protein